MNSAEEVELLHVRRKVSYWTLIYRPTERISFNVLFTVPFP
jgi:hypothetical protein